jgi:hypothetical protein
LTFGVVLLLGNSECGVATNEELARLRLLTPTAKAFTALRAVTAMEECMAALGAQGYIEETGFGRCVIWQIFETSSETHFSLIRDALVEKIWEGTVDVMALDLIRATRDGYTLESFCQVRDLSPIFLFLFFIRRKCSGELNLSTYPPSSLVLSISCKA